MNTRLVGLSVVAALLGGYLLVQGTGLFNAGGDVGVTPPADVVAPGTVAVKLNPLQDLDPESFSAIIEKPLFNPTRQPRPAEPVAPPPPEQPMVEEPPPPPPMAQGPGPEDYKLLGVSSGPDGRIAAVRVSASGEVVYLRKGESVDSWSVVDVGNRTVAIGTPESSVTYAMFDSSDADTESDGGQPAAAVPGQAQPLPLPLPLPMPVQPKPPSGQPELPEQHTLPPDTGG
ncbi:MAG: hypothetical protein WCJ41_07625 [Aestuariivirga sp.]|uniref:hypothetical protein n=1 Tax=Aestuariivirga sp. TaxID=2650926 RepID=UPI003017F91F